AGAPSPSGYVVSVNVPSAWTSPVGSSLVTDSFAAPSPTAWNTTLAPGVGWPLNRTAPRTGYSFCVVSPHEQHVSASSATPIKRGGWYTAIVARVIAG